jgi:4-amino-4-deoxychorismate lyase
MIQLHCARILAAARVFSWTAVLDNFDGRSGHAYFHALLSQQVPIKIQQTSLESTVWKVRILVSEDGNVQVLPAPVDLQRVKGIPVWPELPSKLPEPPANQACRVLVDRIPTSASTLTTHKTSSRGHYDKARTRFNIEGDAPTESEVLLFNEDKEVMEASLCTPYFLRNGVWITPAFSSGGNAGVSRRLALEAGLCIEQVLQVDELMEGEMIWLSNAVRGFMPGRLHLLQR